MQSIFFYAILCLLARKEGNMHYMSVKQPYFKQLKDGKKTIELRCFDEKRQKIKMGDYIVFTNSENTKENFQAKVVNLYWEKNFNALCNKIQPYQAGFRNKNDLTQALEEFYSPNDQQKFGVVGIEIGLIQK